MQDNTITHLGQNQHKKKQKLVLEDVKGINQYQY